MCMKTLHHIDRTFVYVCEWKREVQLKIDFFSVAYLPISIQFLLYSLPVKIFFRIFEFFFLCISIIFFNITNVLSVLTVTQTIMLLQVGSFTTLKSLLWLQWWPYYCYYFFYDEESKSEKIHIGKINNSCLYKFSFSWMKILLLYINFR